MDLLFGSSRGSGYENTGNIPERPIPLKIKEYNSHSLGFLP